MDQTTTNRVMVFNGLGQSLEILDVKILVSGNKAVALPYLLFHQTKLNSYSLSHLVLLHYRLHHVWTLYAVAQDLGQVKQVQGLTIAANKQVYNCSRMVLGCRLCVE
ncbi:hypothetical protein E3N88_20197 [Mikania micrantha]|uniref:Uncharacterized protein n=1 Tax=Mikania micrantha TaxID=192012 RepID=A0A5N6NGS8_9ASTR|nr:hypothetical protein E3N88_20197 [Mikania micrantha]